MRTNGNIIINNQYNIGHICTRLQCEQGHADKVALRYLSPQMDKTDYTFGELERLSNRFAAVLQSCDFQPGDVFCIFLPKIPDVFIAILGALKCRVIAGTLFANIGDETLYDRLYDSKARGIITKKSFLKKLLPLRDRLPHLQYIFVVDSADHEPGNILSFDLMMKNAPGDFTAGITAPDCPSILHYTSGSTGKPKGALHVHGGIVYQNKTMREIFQIHGDDHYWCTADHGWVTGTTYGVSGPWSSGITQIHYGGAYDPEKWFAILQNESIHIWYTAPTALRMIMREEPEFFSRYDLHSLRHIFSVGEPLNPEIIQWSRKIMKKDIYDTWFQTETGAILIANRPGMQIKPGSMGKPVQGIEPAILDENGVFVDNNKQGHLCLKSGCPSMFVTYLNNPEAYQGKFKNDYYYTGDTAFKDEEGYYWFIGRADDVINTAGHLVGPFEVESALLEIEEVAEAAVIGAPDEMLFEKVVAFVCLKKKYSPSPELELRLRLHVTKHVSSTATPQEIIFTDAIPKNKSGKIMRRVLKARYLGQDVGDISTMEG